MLYTAQTVKCQVKTNYYPEGKALQSITILADIETKNKIEIMPSFDVNKLIDEDKQNEGLAIPYRFGKGFDVCYSLNDGSWTEMEDGRLWSMTFYSKGAYSLNFIFDKLNLPYGAELYIVNSDQTVVYGPVSSEQRITSGVFLTDIIPGETATIYLYEPNISKGMSVLGISKVIHGYRKTNGIGYGYSGSCNNNIACYSSWSTESEAVALVLLSSGTEHCSGALLMTADYSFKPYFLTAFHCIDSNQDSNLSSLEINASENWLFKFDYKQIFL